MRIVGLDGRSYTWNVSQYARNPDRRCSALHNAVRSFLEKEFPVDRILEEVYLPGSYGLIGDFFLPARLLLIEAHGVQHSKHTPFFQKSILDFLNQKKRDNQKREWCRLNGIRIVELYHEETTEEWQKKIALS